MQHWRRAVAGEYIVTGGDLAQYLVEAVTYASEQRRDHALLELGVKITCLLGMRIGRISASLQAV